MKEQELQNLIVKSIQAIGGWARQITATPQSGKGIPDILACYKGQFVAVEVKHGTKLSKPQEREIEEIRDASGMVFVVDDPLEIPYLIEHLQDYIKGKKIPACSQVFCRGCGECGEKK